MHLVIRDTITALVNQGDLGILDIENMNKAIDAKWIYNYANNREALWRKMACACSKGDLNILMLVIS